MCRVDWRTGSVGSQQSSLTTSVTVEPSVDRRPSRSRNRRGRTRRWRRRVRTPSPPSRCWPCRRSRHCGRPPPRWPISCSGPRRSSGVTSRWDRDRVSQPGPIRPTVVPVSPRVAYPIASRPPSSSRFARCGRPIRLWGDVPPVVGDAVGATASRRGFGGTPGGIDRSRRRRGGLRFQRPFVETPSVGGHRNHMGRDDGGLLCPRPRRY